MGSDRRGRQPRRLGIASKRCRPGGPSWPARPGSRLRRCRGVLGTPAACPASRARSTMPSINADRRRDGTGQIQVGRACQSHRLSIAAIASTSSSGHLDGSPASPPQSAARRPGSNHHHRVARVRDPDEPAAPPGFDPWVRPDPRATDAGARRRDRRRGARRERRPRAVDRARGCQVRSVQRSHRPQSSAEVSSSASRRKRSRHDERVAHVSISSASRRRSSRSVVDELVVVGPVLVGADEPGSRSVDRAVDLEDAEQDAQSASTEVDVRFEGDQRCRLTRSRRSMTDRQISSLGSDTASNHRHTAASSIGRGRAITSARSSARPARPTC